VQIRWTTTASKNLSQIEEYISKDNPGSAIDVVLKIINAISLLKDQPAMGRPGRVVNTKELIIPGTPYIVPYRIKNRTVEVLRVFHCSMKWA
jgi:toxin ParE1/3/4